MKVKVPKCEIHHKRLVCPSCVAAEAGSRGGKVVSEAKVAASRKNMQKALEVRQAKNAERIAKREPLVRVVKKDPRVWGLEDTIEYLKAHRNEVITAGEIVKAAPRAKKDSAVIYAGQHLVKLEKRKELTRMDRGAYSYTPWRVPDTASSLTEENSAATV